MESYLEVLVFLVEDCGDDVGGAEAGLLAGFEGLGVRELLEVKEEGF